MTIAVLWASPNEDGLTAAAKDQVVSGILNAGSDVEPIHLNRRDVKRCLACGDGWGLCQSEGRCVIADDLGDMYGRLIASEGIVWITPVYWHDMAESMKSFFDRVRRIETGHNHALQGKENLLIACAGGTGRGAVRCLSLMEETLGHMKMTTADRLPVIQFNRGYMLPALHEAGRAFASHLRTTK